MQVLFKSVYESGEGEVYFGKSFTYNPQKILSK